MSLRRGLHAIVAFGIGVVLAGGPTSGQTLKVGGTGSVTVLLGQIAPAFTADTGIALDTVPGLGTSGAISAVGDGKLGLAFSGRPLCDAGDALLRRAGMIAGK
jgi:ABC-type molybdate transport system substrate-binding protein